MLVACGSAAPSTPTAIAPVSLLPLRPLPPAARVTCADAGAILRGVVEDSHKAGPAKEAAIASVCLFDKWSQEILDCVARYDECPEKLHF